MADFDLPVLDAKFRNNEKKFDEGVLRSFVSENSERIYIIKDEFDLEEYAQIIKHMLESFGDLKQDFD